MSTKRARMMLPPKPSAKRDMSVNVRFTQAEYQALGRIAAYRAVTVTELVYHVVSQAALPQLQEEMAAELATDSTATTEPADLTNPLASPSTLIDRPGALANGRHPEYA